jgi:hypothetical protein
MLDHKLFTANGQPQFAAEHLVGKDRFHPPHSFSSHKVMLHGELFR